MSTGSEWQNFYSAIKDTSWPSCETIEDMWSLPKSIQLEIVKNHLFENLMTRLSDKIQHVDTNVPNFLSHLSSVQSLIGVNNCYMNMQDVIFLYSMVFSKKPLHTLEIGHYKGWSTCVMYGALCDNNHGHIYSVDINDEIEPAVKAFLQSRTMLIHESSSNLLQIAEIKDKKFQLIFIDGDHSYDWVLLDLHNAVQLADVECCFLMHDIDLDSVNQAVDSFVESRSDITDCGIYGQKIKLLYRKVNA
jgi:predicted O-methyltransferase YrrM